MSNILNDLGRLKVILSFGLIDHLETIVKRVKWLLILSLYFVDLCFTLQDSNDLLILLDLHSLQNLQTFIVVFDALWIVAPKKTFAGNVNKGISMVNIGVIRVSLLNLFDHIRVF